jgi:RNA polymerase sigma-70 factor (ECF subfamily)
MVAISLGMSSITSPSEEDAELVRRFKAGDERAFVEIVTRHRETVFAIAMSLLRNRADAEEIAADTFIRAHRGMANFRGDSSLKTWLHRITVNLARNRYWYFWRRKRHLTASLDSPMGDDGDRTFAELHPCSEPGPSAQVEHEELVALTARMMGMLKPSHREILILRNEQHKDYAEIATALGISIGTVKSRIARARDYLWAKVAESCPGMRENA